MTEYKNIAARFTHLQYVHVAILSLISSMKRCPGCKSSQAQKMQHTPDTHQRTVYPAACGGGGLGTGWIMVHEWVWRSGWADMLRVSGPEEFRGLDVVTESES